MATPELDLKVYERAGLYDPDAPDAAERAELIAFLVEEGCTLDEMTYAHARGRLFALAGDRLIRPGRDAYTLAEVASRLGVEEESVRRSWRACGLVEPIPGTPCASDDDIAAIGTFLALSEALGVEPTLGLARVIGSSMSRIGEALSAAVRGNADTLNLAITGSEVVTARAFAGAAGLIGPAGRAIDTLFRHHIESARSLFEEAVEPDSGQQRISMGVGFIDLCDYTALSGQLDPEKLGHLLTRFEEISFDVAADAGARVVKFLGDAVMFVAPDPAMVVDAAIGLMNHPDACSSGLSARGGITYGTVLAQDGDFFGAPVNLAARLVAAAEPNVVLLAADVVQRIDSSLPLEPIDELRLRGIDAPVRASVLRPMALLPGASPTPAT